MADKIDMSLDEIIKVNKTERAGAGERVAGGGDQGTKISGRSRLRNRRSSKNNQELKKCDNSKTRTRTRRAAKNTTEIKRIKRAKSTNDNHHWSQSGKKSVSRRKPKSSTGAGVGKLMISNLDLAVSENDIQELFSEFGELKSVCVHFDRSSRSLGTADVEYKRKSDAIKAIKQYDGVPLDGKAMKIEMVSSDDQNNIPMLTPRSSSSMPRRKKTYSVRKPVGGKIGKRAVQKRRTVGAGKLHQNVRSEIPRGSSKRNAKRGNVKKMVPDRETLDKELDKFMQERNI